MPTRETGAVAFKKSHPTYDGRGVTIGILDSGVDLDHPALQKTSTGERKIVDWVTATDPLLESDLTWRAMLTDVSGPTFTYRGLPPGPLPRATTPSTGSPRASPRPASPTVTSTGTVTPPTAGASSTTRRPTTSGSTSTRTSTSPTTRRCVRTRRSTRSGHFGKDDPATTDVVERMPFVVEYREDVDLTPAGLPAATEADFVNIGIPEAAHGSHVAGITAANDMFGGTMDGAAPGAKIVSARACSWGGGCTAVALTEGMIDLVANRGVDVVNMSIGGLPALNDGNNARAELYNRLIDEYGVQLFISAGNSGPGLNTIGDPSVATDVVSVASSISKETWRANYGSEVSSPLNLHNYSSRGPREDGGFKPNISAPGSAVSTVPLWLNRAGHRRDGLHPAGRLRPLQRHLDGLSAGRGRRGTAAERRPPGRPGRSRRLSCARRSTPLRTSSRASRPPARATASSTSPAPGSS